MPAKSFCGGDPEESVRSGTGRNAGSSHLVCSMVCFTVPARDQVLTQVRRQLLSDYYNAGSRGRGMFQNGQTMAFGVGGPECHAQPLFSSAVSFVKGDKAISTFQGRGEESRSNRVVWRRLPAIGGGFCSFPLSSTLR